MLIKKFTASVTLNHRDRHGVDNLVGREALAARGALATALYARAVGGRTRVEDSGIGKITYGALHFLYPFAGAV